MNYKHGAAYVQACRGGRPSGPPAPRSRGCAQWEHERAQSEAAEAAKASEERISQLEGELAALRAQELGTLPGPERGGDVGPGWGRELPGPEASALEQMATGLRPRRANGRER